MTNFAPRRIAVAALVCLAAASWGCDRSNKSEGRARDYETRGIVRGFGPDRATIEIEHETIPGFMPSMTMPFTPREAREIAALRTGDAISFDLEVTDKDFRIAHVQKIPKSAVHLPIPRPTASANVPRLREGGTVPDFRLTSQSGATITLDSFRGRPWVVTFIFTRCPMPNFCPLMSKKFLKLQHAIETGKGALASTRLVSITIDPKFDTPAVLQQYAEQESANADVWTFATGDPSEIDRLTQSFAVYRQTEAGTISHGLTTALIDRQGKIARLWRGNDWKIEDVLAAINAIDPGDGNGSSQKPSP